MANYTNWNGGPNNLNGTEHFAHIHLGSTKRKWNDCPNDHPGFGNICDAPLYGLCQFNLWITLCQSFSGFFTLFQKKYNNFGKIKLLWIDFGQMCLDFSIIFNYDRFKSGPEKLIINLLSYYNFLYSGSKYVHLECGDLENK